MKALNIELDIVDVRCGLRTSGDLYRLRQVTCVSLARVDSRSLVAKQATWVLPRPTGVVPMEAKLGQNAGDCGGLLARKLNPHPFADNLGEFKELRRLALK